MMVMENAHNAMPERNVVWAVRFSDSKSISF